MRPSEIASASATVERRSSVSTVPPARTRSTGIGATIARRRAEDLLEKSLQHGDQIVEPRGLDEERGEAFPCGARMGFGPCVSGERDHRRRRAYGPETAGELEPVHPGETEIKHDRGRPHVRRQLQRIL